MQLSKNDIEITKRNKSQFVSLKYLGEDGTLKQIDSCILNLEEGVSFAEAHEINLKTIKDKNFIDPFRSFPTTSFFCENIANKNNSRQLLTELSNEICLDRPSFAAEISFWTEEEGNSNNHKDPLDRHANLRSDIIATLENINIKTGVHFHGTSSGESLITIKGQNIIDLSDNILIAQFIIANVADSYGLNIKFTAPKTDTANITLLIKGKQTNLEELSNIIEKNIAQISLLKNNNLLGFKLKKTYLYVTNTPGITCKISLVCSDLFSPYLVSLGLLFYNSHKELFISDLNEN